MKKHSYFFILFFLILNLPLTGQNKPAYQIFSANGELVDYHQMAKELKESEIIFFGELHNNPIAHWLQLSLTEDLFKVKGENLVLGAEMFEADNQLIMNEYLLGEIREKDFESEARLWNNYQTDYKPLVTFAKENEVDFIATNIPRRYAAKVSKEGFEGLEGLNDEAKSYFAPLPVKYDSTLSCYKDMLQMMHMPAMRGKINYNLPKAQAIKDATMAHFILENFSQETLFLHFNGSYHSDNYEGIVWYVKQEMPEVKVKTISVVLQNEISSLEESNMNVADYLIVVPVNMTTTY